MRLRLYPAAVVELVEVRIYYGLKHDAEPLMDVVTAEHLSFRR